MLSIFSTSWLTTGAWEVDPGGPKSLFLDKSVWKLRIGYLPESDLGVFCILLQLAEGSACAVFVNPAAKFFLEAQRCLYIPRGLGGGSAHFFNTVFQHMRHNLILA